jgi:hypothetical protein
MVMADDDSVMPYPSRTVAPKHTLRKVITSSLMGEAPEGDSR